MLTSVYRLVRPRQFELVFNDITLDKSHVIVHPVRLSICNADQRYYQGLRAENILRKKLPMALIHEAVGRVAFDPTGQFEEGTLVVMIPNTPTEKDDIIAENYLRSSQFRASGFDGFMQEYVSMEPDRLVALPEDVNLSVAAFTEIVSVSYHTIQRFLRFSHSRRDVIGVGAMEIWDISLPFFLKLSCLRPKSAFLVSTNINFTIFLLQMMYI